MKHNELKPKSSCLPLNLYHLVELCKMHFDFKIFHLLHFCHFLNKHLVEPVKSTIKKSCFLAFCLLEHCCASEDGRWLMITSDRPITLSKPQRVPAGGAETEHKSSLTQRCVCTGASVSVCVHTVQKVWVHEIKAMSHLCKPVNDTCENTFRKSSIKL